MRVEIGAETMVTVRPRLVLAAFLIALICAACGGEGNETSQQATEQAEETSQLGSSTTTMQAAASKTAVSETTAIETTVSEATVSEATVSETTALEAMVSETTALETTAADETALETKVPEETVLGTTVVETTEPEPTPQITEAEVSTSVAPVIERERELVDQNWSVMATFEDVVLLHPSNRVERVGFHESNHDGARQMVPSDSVVNSLVLESRERDTGSRTAADVVVQPDTEIRAPVTGTVIRSGGYILYCKHNDDFVVIEPDSHPGWEVKVLHISGVTVTKGDRVEAGVTVLAPAATPLPFDSQVDEFTAEPSWPHVHIEIVDPSIPDRPSKGGGGC